MKTLYRIATQYSLKVQDLQSKDKVKICVEGLGYTVVAKEDIAFNERLFVVAAPIAVIGIHSYAPNKIGHDGKIWTLKVNK